MPWSHGAWRTTGMERVCWDGADITGLIALDGRLLKIFKRKEDVCYYEI
jgi:hypothetical protein